MKRLSTCLALIVLVFNGSTTLANVSIERITDINPGSGASSPLFLTEFNNKLYFVARDNETRGYGQLWSYDGQTVTRESDVYVNTTNNPGNQLVEYNGDLYFGGSQTPGEDYELWKFDGHNASLAAEIYPTDRSSEPRHLAVYHDKLYYLAKNDDAVGNELWNYDGQTASLVADIKIPFGSGPHNMTVVHDELLFSANDGEIDPLTDHGYELWKFDGQNVSMVADIKPGILSSNPERFTIFQDDLYFLAHDAQYYRFFKYDGTGVEALPLSLNNAYLGSPLVGVYNGRMYYEGYDGGLWCYDGTQADRVAEFSRVFHMFAYEDILYFSAKDKNNSYGGELWQFDGETVSLVADINIGEGSSGPFGFTVFNNQLYFSARTDDYGQELYRLTVPEPGSLMALGCLGIVTLWRRVR